MSHSISWYLRALVVIIKRAYRTVCKQLGIAYDDVKESCSKVIGRITPAARSTVVNAYEA